jgi:hypothetical protein
VAFDELSLAAHPSCFGRTFFEKITSFLRLMLESKDENEWEFSYRAARGLLADDPEKCSKLDAIHSNPLYYAGYIL